MVITRRRSRPRFTLILLVLTSITVITLDFSTSGRGFLDDVRRSAVDALAPVRDGVGNVLDPVGDAFSGVTGYGELEDENAVLRDRIAALEGAALADEGARGELEETLDLLEIGFVGDLPTVAARVVSTPVSNFELTVELDKGSIHGIAADMPVVTDIGLVGRVLEVTERRSVVRLITDPASAVGVRLDSGDLGVAQGEGPGRDLSVSLIEVGTAPTRGSLLTTSGVQDSIFPGGIPIGRITASTEGAGALQQEVHIEPVVDLGRIRVVKVIMTGSGGGP